MYVCISVCLQCLTVSLCICLSDCEYVCLFTNLPVYLFLRLCPSICMSVFLFVCMSLSMSHCMFVCLSVLMSFCLFVWLSVNLSLFVCLSVSLSDCLWVCLCLSAFRTICLYICSRPIINISACLSVFLYVYVSVGVSVSPSLCESTCRYVSMPFWFYTCLCLFIYLTDINTDRPADEHAYTDMNRKVTYTYIYIYILLWIGPVGSLVWWSFLWSPGFVIAQEGVLTLSTLRPALYRLSDRRWDRLTDRLSTGSLTGALWRYIKRRETEKEGVVFVVEAFRVHENSQDTLYIVRSFYAVLSLLRRQFFLFIMDSISIISSSGFLLFE